MESAFYLVQSAEHKINQILFLLKERDLYLAQTRTVLTPRIMGVAR